MKLKIYKWVPSFSFKSIGEKMHGTVLEHLYVTVTTNQQVGESLQKGFCIIRFVALCVNWVVGMVLSPNSWVLDEHNVRLKRGVEDEDGFVPRKCCGSPEHLQQGWGSPLHLFVALVFLCKMRYTRSAYLRVARRSAVARECGI